MRSCRGAVAAAVLSIAIVAGTAGGAPTSADASSTPTHRGVPAFSHVMVVVMENLEYSSAMSTPSLVSLAQRWELATRYYAVAHPSLPNYLALSAGGTFGVTSDCVTCYVSAPNLFSQLAGAHISFDAYLEGVPSACYLAPWGGTDYASKHNPFRYFVDVRSSPSLCSHLRPMSDLAGALRRPPREVPRFMWVTPNLCHDGHDCAAKAAAHWLQGFVSTVTASTSWRQGGVLFVVWDEGEGDDAAVRPGGLITSSGGGGHVMALVIAPTLAPGRRVATPLNHYSLLATIEDAFHLSRLSSARSATNFATFFSSAPSSR